MPDPLMEAMLDRADDLGWKTVKDENGCIEFSQFSPAGEDFSFDVYDVKEPEDLADQVREYAEDFDTEEHIAMWIGAKRSGVGGVPSIKELVKDADDIQKMLNDFASALEEML